MAHRAPKKTIFYTFSWGGPKSNQIKALKTPKIQGPGGGRKKRHFGQI